MVQMDDGFKAAIETLKKLNKKNIAQKKCCETCAYGWLLEDGMRCANRKVPRIKFEDDRGDPAEFQCNHWQAKEDQK